MPKTKPTYDDMTSALYDIWELVDEVPSEYDTEMLKAIRKICKDMLPD